MSHLVLHSLQRCDVLHRRLGLDVLNRYSQTLSMGDTDQTVEDIALDLV